jgi:hypothetical protein
MHTGLAKRIPKGNLVGGKYRPTQIFLERRNDTNYTEAVAAKQNGLSRSRHLRPRPCVKLSRIYLGKFAQRIVGFGDGKTP